MDDGFGPYGDDEMRVALALVDQVDRNEAFERARRRYEEYVGMYNQSVRDGVSVEAMQALETDRRALHEQVIQLAHRAGRPGREALEDGGRKALISIEHNLSGFRVVTRDDLEFFEDEELSEDEVSAERRDGFASCLKEGELGIVFADCFSTVIPSRNELSFANARAGYSRYTGPSIRLEVYGERERIRRAERLAKKMNIPLLRAVSFSHNVVVEIVAVVVNARTLDEVISEIRAHSNEFGRELRDMPVDIVERDRMAYEEYVTQHVPSDRRDVFEHMYRKLHSADYAVTDAEFVPPREYIPENVEVSHSPFRAIREEKKR